MRVWPHRRAPLVFVVTRQHLCISIWMEHTVSGSEQLEMRAVVGNFLYKVPLLVIPVKGAPFTRERERAPRSPVKTVFVNA